MKIKLSVSDESYAEIKQSLEAHGITIDEESDLILIQKDQYPGHMTVRRENGEKTVVAVSDIITIESYGHTVEISTANGVFKTSDRLYRIEKLLDPCQFLRISNSVIIAKAQVKEITPTFSMKFILKMKNNTRVDVTRGYYSKFKAYFGI